MATFITVVHVITCILIVLVVLIQSGKGAEISASFGGSSQTVFGSSGGANFFVKLTRGAAAVFFVTSLALTVMGAKSRKSLFEGSMPSAASSATGAPTAPVAGATNGPAQQTAPAGAERAKPAPAAPKK